MHTFTVWAPDAATVSLVLSTESLEMTRADDGWWTLEVPDAGHGTDYAFSIDGSDPMPDPRSPWQPHGVHGSSRVFDASRFSWNDAEWAGRDVRGAVFYELHLGTFTPEGTLDAAAERLDHLVALGVQVVSLLPVAAFPGRHGWGYDGVDLYAVHEPYGGPEALQRFVDRCHTAGLAVCLDVVYNHLGPSGNYLDSFGPYFTSKHTTPWGPAVNLDDKGSDGVRRWICDNALRWFREFHIDALRLDAVHALQDDSPQHVLAQLSVETAQLSAELGRPLGLVAESDLNDPRMVEPVAEGGLGMTAQWSDDYHHALHALLTGESAGYYEDFAQPGVFEKTLTQVFLHDGSYSSFRGKDWGHTVDPARHRGSQFLAYTSNHDQVGNRALGDRPALTPGQLAIGAALVITSPYTPMLFMGEEWGASTPWRYFTDHEEPELADAVRNGRREEFGAHGWDADEIPDPQDPATWQASLLDWTELDASPHRELLAWYRDLLALRARDENLRDDRLGSVAVTSDAGGDWMVVSRGDLRVVVNLADAERVVPVDRVPRDVVTAFGEAEIVTDGVRLAGHSVGVFAV
ncbi:malto-oligosyltrehalose trehalohydrolase [Kribbella flavida DSM 17836]|uniref:Malto-oligosyltrehalose trehalohydrolase n=1 Tax=Kribbella flavida (strain DSM 17836 / JCM 10339 / NBRC 14399) TaxID=479435 RepID=D2PYL2_KRIFD|nr:malto-oligosyltrehalose trehalohydrolase [Kribbella flavida]ADB29858.1 malto-oligosyltrehalose trehalohydrolase [Kribbella flavida DSM 17836]